MSSIELNKKVQEIKENKYEINKFIEEYKPFIASCVQKSAGRYVRYGEDDELSIALMAFSEAIKAYNPEKSNFLTFASNVIRRRLIDYYRKENKHRKNVPLNACQEDEEYESDYSINKSIDNYSKQEVSEYRRLEIEELKEELFKWGISFYELVSASPKHLKTRKLYSRVIKLLISEKDLLHSLKTKKQLPVNKIAKNLKVSRKKIERGRKYIITVVLIITGNYQYIRDYVNWW